MPADVGDYVHPWYKGVHEWLVKKVAKLDKPTEYHDPDTEQGKGQGQVRHDPRIMLLESKEKGKVLWFPYLISTHKTNGKMKWGQRPPMLEEEVFLELLSKAIQQDMFSNQFLKKLSEEIQAKTASV